MAARRSKYRGLDVSGVGRRGSKLSGGKINRKAGRAMPSKYSSSARGRSRRGGGSYIGGARRQPRFSRRGLLAIIVVAVIAVALAVSVGYVVYQQTYKNALTPKLNVESLDQALYQMDDEDEPCWAVFAKTDAASAEEGRGSITDVALVRFDYENASITFLWIPTRTRVYIDGYGYRGLSDAFSEQGEIGLSAAIGKLAGVEVAHYFEANSAGLSRFEEQLEPLGVNVHEAGRDEVTDVLCKKVFGSSLDQMPSYAEKVVACFGTDMSQEEATTMLQNLHGLDTESGIRQADAPSSIETEDGLSYETLDDDEWGTIVTRVGNGMAPYASESEIKNFDAMRAGATVSVWNGVGVNGVAKDCETELTKIGWKVINTGNAANFVYDETLVVYKEDDDKELAKLLVSDLGQGRVVRSAMRYSYDGNVLVVVGKDYKPY